jgi:hypothetical protein
MSEHMMTNEAKKGYLGNAVAMLWELFPDVVTLS